MTLENTQEIINGAEVLAAGRMLGLSDDETIATKMQTRRREQRQRRQERGKREKNRAAAEEFLRREEREFEAKGNYKSKIDDVAFAFGEDPEYMGGERRPQDDEQSYTRAEKIRNDALPDEFYTDSEFQEQSEGRGREPFSSTSGIPDALNRLREGKDRFGPGYEGFGADTAAMTELDSKLEGRLKGTIGKESDRRQAERAAADDRRVRRGDLTDKEINQRIARRVREARPEGGLQGGKRFDRDVELAAALTQEMEGRRERGKRGVPEMVAMINEAKAAREADEIRNKFGGLPRQLADADIGRINEIRSLGGAMPFASHDAVGNFQVVQSVNPDDFGVAIPLTDKDGQVREYYGYEDSNLVQLGEVNVDSSDQVLNAPKPTPGQDFISRNLPAYGREGGTTFGFPQVGINDEMALLGDRIRGLKGYGYENIGNPRTLADFDQAMGAIIARGQSQGDTFFRFDPETRKTVGVAEPTVEDVLYKLGYSDSESARLANALYQGEAASKVDINQADKQAFAARQNRAVNERDDLEMNVGEMRPDGGSALQKIVNEKVGRGKKAKSARAGLAGISEEAIVKSLRDSGRLLDENGNLLPDAKQMIEGARMAREDAQRPLIGALASEGAPRAAFIRGKDRGRGEAALARQYGASQAATAAGVEQRYLADRAKREAAVIGGSEAPFRNYMDNQFFTQAQARNAELSQQSEVAERAEIARLMTEGARGKVGPNELYGGRMVSNPLVPGQRLEVPAEILNRAQPTQKAPVAPSIAPDPGVPTGNQPAPMSDAGGPMPDDMRRELFSLPGPNQGPEPSTRNYMSAPEGPSSIAGRRKKNRENFRNRAYRNIAMRDAGVVSGAVLASILGLNALTDEEQKEAV